MAGETSAPATSTTTTESAPTTTTAPPTTTTTAPTETTTAPVETLYGKDTPTDRPEWLSTKYKTVEDQAKAYTDLHKMYLEKNEVPEKYDFTEVFKNHNMEITDQTRYDSFQTELRDLGINSKQATALMDRYAAEVQTIIKPFADKIAELTPPNLKEERSKLEQEWGNKTNDNLTSAGKWARANLPKDVADALGRTANGIKFVAEMMNGERGPVPISEHTTPSAVDPGEIQTKIKDIMSNKDYMKNDAKGKQMQKEVYTLHKQLRQIRGQSLTQ